MRAINLAFVPIRSTRTDSALPLSPPASEPHRDQPQNGRSSRGVLRKIASTKPSALRVVRPSRQATYLRNEIVREIGHALFSTISTCLPDLKSHRLGPRLLFKLMTKKVDRILLGEPWPEKLGPESLGHGDVGWTGEARLRGSCLDISDQSFGFDPADCDSGCLEVR